MTKKEPAEAEKRYQLGKAYADSVAVLRAAEIRKSDTGKAHQSALDSYAEALRRMYAARRALHTRLQAEEPAQVGRGG